MTEYLPSRITHNYNFVVTESTDLTLPIAYYSTNSDVIVEFELMYLDILKDTGDKQYNGDTIGRKKWILTKQTGLSQDGYNFFSRILTKKELNKTGTYTGVIRVKKHLGMPTNGKTNLIDLQPVTITVNPNPLDVKTEFKSKNGSENYTLRDMIVSVFGSYIVQPRNIQSLKNGKYQVTYGSAQKNDYIQLFRSSNGSYMPQGSTATVLNECDGGIVAGYHRVPLMRTNKQGKDIVTGLDITRDNKEASYLPITDLPCGDYMVYAEYPGDDCTSKVSDYIPFKIK